MTLVAEFIKIVKIVKFIIIQNLEKSTNTLESLINYISSTSFLLLLHTLTFHQYLKILSAFVGQ